jgi:hypothetical protein
LQLFPNHHQWALQNPFSLDSKKYLNGFTTPAIVFPYESIALGRAAREAGIKQGARILDIRYARTLHTSFQSFA